MHHYCHIVPATALLGYLIRIGRSDKMIVFMFYSCAKTPFYNWCWWRCYSSFVDHYYLQSVAWGLQTGSNIFQFANFSVQNVTHFTKYKLFSVTPQLYAHIVFRLEGVWVTNASQLSKKFLIHYSWQSTDCTNVQQFTDSKLIVWSTTVCKQACVLQGTIAWQVVKAYASNLVLWQ